jgi:N-acetylglucosamine-6-phosphate deacetylase
VLPAHLESNFVNPEFAGAQPLECLRVPADLEARSTPLAPGGRAVVLGARRARHHRRVPAGRGIVTLAPELDGGLDLVRSLCGADIVCRSDIRAPTSIRR